MKPRRGARGAASSKGRDALAEARVPSRTGLSATLGVSGDLARVDRAARAPVEYEPPVQDWLRFLAELLAAEYLREHAGGTAA